MMGFVHGLRGDDRRCDARRRPDAGGRPGAGRHREG